MGRLLISLILCFFCSAPITLAFESISSVILTSPMLSSPSPGPYCGCTAISLCGTTDLSECSSADATVYWTFEGDHTEAYQTHVYIYEKDAITDDIALELFNP